MLKNRKASDRVSNKFQSTGMLCCFRPKVYVFILISGLQIMHLTYYDILFPCVSVCYINPFLYSLRDVKWEIYLFCTLMTKVKVFHSSC